MPRSYETWIASLHDEDRPRVLARVDAVLRTPGDDEWDVEFRSVRPDGTTVWHHGRGHADRDADGRVTRFLGIDLDITPHKLTAFALQDAKDRQHAFAETTRLLLGTASQGIISVDHQGTVLMANAAIERMFGYRANELVGDPIEKLLPTALRGAHVGHRLEYFNVPRPRPMGLGLDLRPGQPLHPRGAGELDLLPTSLTVRLPPNRQHSR